MDELTRKLARARDHVTPHADEAALDRQWRGLVAKRRRRAVTRATAGAASVLLAALGAWRLAAPAPSVATSPSLRLPDGSLVFFLEPDTEVTPVAIGETRVALALSRGRARFDVSRRPERTFVVDAADVRVTVVGTEFVVSHATDEVGDEVEVEVSEGRVRVDAAGETRFLRAGERGLFPTRPALDSQRAPQEETDEEPAEEPASSALATPPQEAATLATPPQEAAPPALAPVAAERRARPPRETTPAGWRALAEEGEFEAAYEALRAADDVRASDAGDLLLAADAARLSGHPREAVGYLRRVIDDHPADSRAPLAAFTLGRVLLRSAPAEAAAAFAEAARLDPASSLTQDALAREVEAWHRAGQQERARALAEAYLARFPSGLRADAVRRYGGLD